MRWPRRGWCLLHHTHELNSIENRVSHFFFVFTRFCTGSASRTTQTSSVGRGVQWQLERMTKVVDAAAAAALGMMPKLIFLPLMRWQVRSQERGDSCCEPIAWPSWLPSLSNKSISSAPHGDPSLCELRPRVSGASTITSARLQLLRPALAQPTAAMLRMEKECEITSARNKQSAA